MGISASGMTAERLRMDIIASNIANANSTRTEAGGPYRRKMPVFAEDAGVAGPKGARVLAVTDDQSPLKKVYDPGHPDAGSDGYVMFPNVEPVKEMVDLITAMRAYEANATLVSTAKALASKALEIGRG
jgi:flagellar basal-body rod protein FlgC